MDSTGETKSHKTGDDLHPLTILRFFVAFWVVFAHQFMFWKWIQAPVWEPIRRVLDRGDCAVKVFFILSGFILTHVYAEKARFSARSFFVARFARIYPLYITALVIAIPYFWLFQVPEELNGHSHALGWTLIGIKSLSVLLLVQSWIPAFAPFWNPASWSLSTESFFYAIFPYAIHRLKRLSSTGIALIYTFCFIVEITRWVMFNASFNASAAHGSAAFWVFTPLLRLPDFISGVLIGLLWMRGLRLPPAASILAAGFIFLGCVLPPTNEILKIILIHLGCAGLISSLAFPCRISGLWIRIGVLLGQCSYAVYLIHEPLGLLFSVGSAKIFGFQLPYFCYITLLIAISLALFLWVESPARNFLRRKLS